MVEIVGVVGIIASMILVAAELRKSNDLASTQAEMALADQFNALHLARASNPEIAKLFPKLESPQAHLTTATDASQIRGIAWHYVNSLRSVQNAYKDELISRKVRDSYIVELAQTLEEWPGIRSHYVDIYQKNEALHGTAEFAPIAEFIAAANAVPATD